MRARVVNWVTERYVWARTRYWGLHLHWAEHRKAKRPAKKRSTR